MEKRPGEAGGGRAIQATCVATGLRRVRNILLPAKSNGCHSLAGLQPYRKVLLQGHWLHDGSILLGPRKYDVHNGYHLITPLVRASSTSPSATTILVNRGFISQAVANTYQQDARRISQAASEQDLKKEVEVLAMMAPRFKPGTFTPNNEPQKGQWIWPDIPAIVEHAGGKAANIQPILVEAVFGSCLPSQLAFLLILPNRGRVRRSVKVGSHWQARRKISSHILQKPARELRHYMVQYPFGFTANSHCLTDLHRYSLSVGTAVLFFRLVTKKPTSHFGRR